MTVANTEINNHNNVMVDHDEDVEIYLSLGPERLINMQNDDTFCKAIMKLINEKKLSSSER